MNLIRNLKKIEPKVVGGVGNKCNKDTMKCVICGKEFVAGTLQAKFCSAECRHKNKLEYRKKYYVPKKQNAVVKNNWNEIVSICSELGISYGEAVARGII